MRASEDLVDEHEGILRGLKILERMASLAGDATKVPRSDAEALVGFFVSFADTCHHGKEEGILFPELEKVGIPRDRGPVGQMLAEHEEGRGHVRGMKRALEGGGFDRTAFAKSAEDYIALLRAHIRKENEVLFPLGDMKLPPEAQASIATRFEEHEEKVMGAGTHERLHAMLDEFEAKYA